MSSLPIATERSDRPNEAAIAAPKNGCCATSRKLLFGVIGPVVFLYADPFLLGGHDGDSIIGSFSVCVYAAVFLSMSVFFLQSLPGRWPGALLAFASGAILAGSLVAMVLGTVVLPFSVLAIPMYGAGLLGLYPFVVGALYYRSACSAWTRAAVRELCVWQRLAYLGCGFLIVLGIPFLMRECANREIARLVASANGIAGFHHVDRRWKRLLTAAGDYDFIVFEYRRVGIEHTRESLATLYENLTRRSIDRRLYQLTHPD